MGKIYVRESGSSQHFPCTEDHMFQFQGSKTDPYTLVVKDQEELEFYEGLRLVTGHHLTVTTLLPYIDFLMDDKIYFTFPTEEIVRSPNKDGWMYRKWKS